MVDPLDAAHNATVAKAKEIDKYGDLPPDLFSDLINGCVAATDPALCKQRIQELNAKAEKQKGRWQLAEARNADPVVVKGYLRKFSNTQDLVLLLCDEFQIAQQQAILLAQETDRWGQVKPTSA